MSAQPGQRLAMVIGSQCAAASPLSFLPELAQELAEVLTDARLGGCASALESGPVLIDPSRAEVVQAVRTAFAEANAVPGGAVLVLAFIGHGVAVDEDFFFLPIDGGGQGRHDEDVLLSQVLKEGLRDSANIDGLMVLLDTCHAGVGAAQAATWRQVGLGRRQRRYEMLTASADRPAYGGTVTRTIIEVVREGIATAGTTIDSRYLRHRLQDAAGAQNPQRITHDGGGWAQTGDEGLWWAFNVAHPDLRLAPAAPVGLATAVPSAYLLQVQRIAPVELLGRERELAELEAFCTADQGGPYVYWRAGPWAGKSALMSWFALHPPAGVRVVSFFITARFAGQSDRVAFTDVMVEQLAALLDEPRPSLTDATREYTFLHLLSRVAEMCQRDGHRLILLVDGLDEDRGVTVGPDAYSIAALLPEKPPAGMRIIVAGRPNPPPPADVPFGHPLYDPATVRRLRRSPQATVAKDAMVRELTHLLRGSPAEQDLLGLLVAAGGGLSARDLAELTGWPDWEVEEHLNTVAGRSFTPRASRWQPDLGPEVYVLGHEELQTTASTRLGPDRLAGYRQRLHTWAERYRAQNWPTTTPEYLLRGYYRLLRSERDLSRMLACATDNQRHNRMLDITGGDAEALNEIITLQALMVGQDSVDLATMGRLAVHRQVITDRNSLIPIDLPAVWARLGKPLRAEALARSITSPSEQEQALVRVAAALTQAGYLDRAEALARAITNPYAQAEALATVAAALAQAGDPDRAEALARSLTDPHQQLEALATVAAALAQAGDPDRAEALAADAEALARAITNPYAQARALAAVAAAPAQTGDPDRAEAIARAITNPKQQARALAAVAAALAQAGDLDRAEAIARAITNPKQQARALAAVAAALAQAGDPDRAAALARSITNQQARALIAVAAALAQAGNPDRAEALARSLTDPFVQARALTAVAAALAEAGDPDRATGLAADAEALARAITKPYAQAEALTAVAAALAQAGDPDRAETLARSLTNPDEQAEALTAVAAALAQAGDPDRAETLAHSITNQQARALIAVAAALAQAGNPDRAEALARSLTNPDEQARALTAVAAALAQAGDPDRAETLARSLTNPDEQAEALTAVAAALAQAGDPERAEALARSITNPYARAEALAAVGFAEARAITNLLSQARALTAFAAALTQAGDPDHAEGRSRSTTHPNNHERSMGAVAAQDASNRARRLIRHALQVGRWHECLAAVAEQEPTAVAAIANEYLSTSPRPGQITRR